MQINRSSFYYWKKMLNNPAPRTKALVENIQLFKEYHLKYPSHGYRWLNAKIRLDKGIKMSDPYAHKCCKVAGIKSKAKHYKYKKPGAPFKIFPNLLMSEMQIDGPGLATLYWTKLLRTRNYFNYSTYPADFKVFNPLYSTGVR